jgi:hypothetical protein
MLFFRHVGKTLSIPPPAGGLSAAIVAVARWRKEYHVVAAVEGHELKTPETEHRPETEHHQHAAGPYLARQLSAFRPRGVPGPTSKLSLRAPAQMGWRETEREGGKWSRRETGVKGETRDLHVCPVPRSGALAVGGYKRPRGRQREAYARRPVLPPRGQPSVRGPWTFLL